jgi:hypothetical protein
MNYAALFAYVNSLPENDFAIKKLQVTQNGELIKTPRWLVNYRHADRATINSFMQNPASARTEPIPPPSSRSSTEESSCPQNSGEKIATP